MTKFGIDIADREHLINLHTLRNFLWQTLLGRLQQVGILFTDLGSGTDRPRQLDTRLGQQGLSGDLESIYAGLWWMTIHNRITGHDSHHDPQIYPIVLPILKLWAQDPLPQCLHQSLEATIRAIKGQLTSRNSRRQYTPRRQFRDPGQQLGNRIDIDPLHDPRRIQGTAHLIFGDWLAAIRRSHGSARRHTILVRRNTDLTVEAPSDNDDGVAFRFDTFGRGIFQFIETFGGILQGLLTDLVMAECRLL